MRAPGSQVGRDVGCLAGSGAATVDRRPASHTEYRCLDPTDEDDVGLHDQIEADLRAAMKARDKAATSALRMAVAALKNRAVADGLGPQGRLDDDAVQQVLATEVKRRREAAAAYEEAGRDESAASELAEVAVYERYLPEQLGDDELAAIVDGAIEATGARGPGDMGPVMKAAMAEVRGRAEGARVSALVRDRLAALKG